MSISYLWKVKALKNTGKVVLGMEVEVIKSGTNAKPNIKEIGDALERKYGIRPLSGCSITYFDIKGVK
ncbi:hypothetical protein Barb4_00109 [Bacteroidales bacterium Barb4]|nr:hypothetical protein Barb4_00109 [Bacteroidales bacterium Barb4]